MLEAFLHTIETLRDKAIIIIISIIFHHNIIKMVKGNLESLHTCIVYVYMLFNLIISFTVLCYAYC